MRALPLAALTAMFFPTLPTSSHIQPREPTAATVKSATEVVEQVSAPSSAPSAPSSAPSEEDADLRCLALNIYHEARSEPESGQIAVALVTLNRVGSNAFPGSICAVVKQGGTKRNRCQFSWWCDGRSDKPKDPQAWRRAMDIARRVLNDSVPDPTRGALYYHASYCSPSWSSAYKRTARIGQHLFYRPSAI
ncbi:cell wall hydrolase [Thiocystis violacea]|uniref:cell wall hydrolase n=1 Tax=Thiocystis violacea TaxID=13725 RepID=UPI0019049E4E|nr:cell wall hydrolase [Thiocystis violacea]MBK1723229.1 cell wall hydrolase [Thiocystis violacea]